MNPLHNIDQLATCREDGEQGDVHVIADAALAWDRETIRWVGPLRELPREYREIEPMDAGGGLVIPRAKPPILR